MYRSTWEGSNMPCNGIGEHRTEDERRESTQTKAMLKLCCHFGYLSLLTHKNKIQIPK